MLTLLVVGEADRLSAEPPSRPWNTLVRLVWVRPVRRLGHTRSTLRADDPSEISVLVT